MKPTTPNKPTRIPHADRPAVVKEHCRCIWVHTRNPDDPEGPALAHMHARHPDCPLHGNRAEEAPF